MKPVIRVLAFLALFVVVAAQQPAAWQSWRYSAPVAAPPSPSGRLVSVNVPAFVTLLARSDWGDVRVIDASGDEVPFVLLARTGVKAIDRRPVRVLEPSAVKGQYRQVVADVGESGAIHNSAHIRIDARQDLLSWVEIAVSGDLREWRVVRDRAPIYVLSQSGRGEDTDVDYPPSASRYLRIRVFDSADDARITGVDVGREVASVAEREPTQIDLGAPATDTVGRSVWTSGGDDSAWPVSRVEFQAPQTMFSRHVIVERSDDGHRWARAADGHIVRAPDGAWDREWLSVDFAEVHARYWRVTIDNQNDAVTAGLTPTLMMAVRRVVLLHEAGGQYRLLYGNSAARTPRYDMAQVTSREDLEAAERVDLGEPQTNAAWVDPAPWTEKHDSVLWVALVVAVVLLGAVAVRTLRSSAA